MRYEYNCMLLFNYRKNLTCKMMGWKVPLHCYFFFSSWFSDYVSWAPLLSDDKLNFHVLCIINPSLALFMPTPALSAAHAWIAKESSLQLELIDIPKKKKNWKSLNLSHRLLNGLISRQSEASNAERQARQIESVSCLWSFLVPNVRAYWHVFFSIVKKLPFICIAKNTFIWLEIQRNFFQCLSLAAW